MGRSVLPVAKVIPKGLSEPSLELPVFAGKEDGLGSSEARSGFMSQRRGVRASVVGRGRKAETMGTV